MNQPKLIKKENRKKENRTLGDSFNQCQILTLTTAQKVELSNTSNIVTIISTTVVWWLQQTHSIRPHFDCVHLAPHIQLSLQDKKSYHHSPHGPSDQKKKEKPNPNK